MVNTVKKLFGADDKVGQPEVSGVRERKETPTIIKVGERLYIKDKEIKVVGCLNETDMMVQLSTMCPFLSHKDYQVEVSDYLFSHFDTVFTFHPESGKVTQHSR
jgi:hypothetical protein